MSIEVILRAVRQVSIWKSRYLFKKIYNKKVDHAGQLFSAFTPGVEECPYALSNEQFVQYGQAAGFTLKELGELARKAGRIELYQKLLQVIMLQHNRNYSDAITTDSSPQINFSINM